MINKKAYLSENIFSKSIETKPTRDGFGVGVVEAGKADSRVVVLCADLTESTRSQRFADEFPERFIEIGIAEQNMAALASGMAAAGKIPFIASYAAFNPGRNYEQIRTTIALNEQPVKICGMHAGLSVGPDGATHQMLEDIGLMRMLPGMTVINPVDSEEARKAVISAAQTQSPIYLRFARSATPVFTTPKTPFVIGKALILWESDTPKIALLATGPMAHRALLAASALDVQGIYSIVLSVPTIKPLDGDAILSVAKSVEHIITIEEHQVAGGFGSAVAEFLSKKYPIPIHFIGIQNKFGQSGEPEELLTEYGLGVPNIVDVAQKLIN